MEESLSFTYFLTLTIVLYCVWLLTKRVFLPVDNKNLPPSPPLLPIIGNLHQLSKLPHHSLHSLSKKYGPILFLRLGSKPVVVISSADVAEKAFKTHDISISGKPEFIATKELYNTSRGMLAVSYGDHWRKLRSIFVSEILSKKHIKLFNSFKDEETSILLENVDKFSSTSTPINLSEMFLKLTNNLICTLAFGKKYSEMKEGKRTLELMDRLNQFLVKFSFGEFIPWLAWIDRLSGFRAELDMIFKMKDELVELGARELHNGLQGDSDNDGCKENIIDVLLRRCIDWDTIKAVAQDTYGAGTKSLASTLEWAMTELMIHPKITKRLQDEIRKVMNGRQDITVSDLEKMHYLKAVIKETFRFHPTLPLLVRATTDDINLMGYDIPACTMVMFNLWAISRDPTCWDEPEKFLPDRFLHSSIDYKGFDFELLPFGAGRRICPGISFATLTIEYVLANLMFKFDWELPHGVEVKDLDVSEKPGVAVGRKVPLFVLPTKSQF